LPNQKKDKIQQFQVI